MPTSRHEIAGASDPHAQRWARIIRRYALGQPAQPEQEQHERDDLDDKLRQCEVRRREPYERQADDETDDAEHRQRSEPVIRRLPCSSDRARDADD